MPKYICIGFKSGIKTNLYLPKKKLTQKIILYSFANKVNTIRFVIVIYENCSDLTTTKAYALCLSKIHAPLGATVLNNVYYC